MWLTLQAPSSEFMSDRDLEQLKADSNVDKGDAVRSKSNASEQVALQSSCTALAAMVYRCRLEVSIATWLQQSI